MIARPEHALKSVAPLPAPEEHPSAEVSKHFCFLVRASSSRFGDVEPVKLLQVANLLA